MSSVCQWFVVSSVCLSRTGYGTIERDKNWSQNGYSSIRFNGTGIGAGVEIVRLLSPVFVLVFAGATLKTKLGIPLPFPLLVQKESE